MFVVAVAAASGGRGLGRANAEAGNGALQFLGAKGILGDFPLPAAADARAAPAEEMPRVCCRTTLTLGEMRPGWPDGCGGALAFGCSSRINLAAMSATVGDGAAASAGSDSAGGRNEVSGDSLKLPSSIDAPSR
jgi:hypothetical protein